MLLFVEICAAVACLAVVVIAVATVRAMYRVQEATDQILKLTGELQQWVGQANDVTHDAGEVLASVREVVVPIRRFVERFESLGARSADLSAAVLEEVEPPIRAAVAVARGVSWGAAYLMGRLFHRFNHGRSSTRQTPVPPGPARSTTDAQ